MSRLLGKAWRGVVTCRTFDSRDEWLNARREPGVIGASEVADVLGAPGCFKGPWALWCERMGHLPPQEDTEELARGRRREAWILAEYQEITGNLVSPAGLTIYQHPVHDWARCTPDALCWGPGHRGPLTGVEAKNVQSWGEWEMDHVEITPGWTGAWPCPPRVVLQSYWSLEVTGWAWWDICAWVRGEFVWHRLHRDEALQAALLEQVGAWRERHLLLAEEPPVDDSAAAWSYYASRDHAAPLREATEEERTLALELARVQRELKAAEKSEARLKNELGQRLQGCVGVALGPAPGRRKKPPRIVWEGGGVQHHEAKPARTVNVAPHLRVRGITEEDEST